MRRVSIFNFQFSKDRAMEHSPIRILGLTMEHVATFRSQPYAKSAGLYAALDRRFGVVGLERPAPSRFDHYCAKLVSFHPDRNVWRARAGLNPWMFRRRTAAAERRLRTWEGHYDLIVQ